MYPDLDDMKNRNKRTVDKSPNKDVDKNVDKSVDNFDDEDEEEDGPEIICVQFSKPNVNKDDGTKVLTVKFPTKR